TAQSGPRAGPGHQSSRPNGLYLRPAPSLLVVYGQGAGLAVPPAGGPGSGGSGDVGESWDGVCLVSGGTDRRGVGRRGAARLGGGVLGAAGGGGAGVRGLGPGDHGPACERRRPAG